MRSLIIIAKTSMMIPELHKLHLKINRSKYDQEKKGHFHATKRMSCSYMSAKHKMRFIPRCDDQRDNKYGNCNCIKENPQ